MATIEQEVAAFLDGAGLSGAGGIEERLARIVAAVEAGRITRNEGVRRFRGELSAAYAAGFLRSSGPASGGGRSTVTRADLATLRRLMSAQLPRIADFIDQVAGGAARSLPDPQRIALYAASVGGATQAGIAAQAFAAGQRVLWVAEDDEATCDPCASCHNRIFTPATLPGLPRTEFCDGWTRCRCRLIPQ